MQHVALAFASIAPCNVMHVELISAPHAPSWELVLLAFLASLWPVMFVLDAQLITAVFAILKVNVLFVLLTTL